MVINDFVGGRRFDVSYSPPASGRVGTGTVYVLDDGFGLKAGNTNGPVAKRIGELQTGNPRRIAALAEIGNATLELEALLHRTLGPWNISGEWFAGEGVLAQAQEAGGMMPFLRGLIASDDHSVVIHR